jgi:hypothetical protein
MSALWINGFVVAQSDKAVGVVPCERDSFKPAQNKILWVPVSKIGETDEGLVSDRSFNIEGEKIERRGTPKSFLVDESFLAKVNATQFAFC